MPDGSSSGGAPGLGELLRHTRVARRLSQLELALRIGASQRHISFLESGRARPSLAMLRNWMEEVEAPRTLRNAAMLQAGYGVETMQTSLDGDPCACARPALKQLIDAHEPFPAFIFNADWIITQRSRGARRLCALVMPELSAEEVQVPRGIDMIAAIAHPAGLLANMRNGRAAGYASLGQLRAEQWTRPSLKPRVDLLEDSLARRFVDALEDSERDPGQPYLHMIFDTPVSPLKFFMIQSVFGLPQDINVASLRIELWYPSDPATRDVMTSLAHTIPAWARRRDDRPGPAAAAR